MSSPSVPPSSPTSIYDPSALFSTGSHEGSPEIPGQQFASQIARLWKIMNEQRMIDEERYTRFFVRQGYMQKDDLAVYLYRRAGGGGAFGSTRVSFAAGDVISTWPLYTLEIQAMNGVLKQLHTDSEGKRHWGFSHPSNAKWYVAFNEWLRASEVTTERTEIYKAEQSVRRSSHVEPDGFEITEELPRMEYRWTDVRDDQVTLHKMEIIGGKWAEEPDAFGDPVPATEINHYVATPSSSKSTEDVHSKTPTALTGVATEPEWQRQSVGSLGDPENLPGTKGASEMLELMHFTTAGIEEYLMDAEEERERRKEAALSGSPISSMGDPSSSESRSSSPGGPPSKRPKTGV